MTQVTLTKVHSLHSNLRTNTVEGKALSLPEVGKRFVMFAAPLTEGADFRQITTSPVVAVFEGGFRTENSVYRLDEVMP